MDNNVNNVNNVNIINAISDTDLKLLQHVLALAMSGDKLAARRIMILTPQFQDVHEEILNCEIKTDYINAIARYIIKRTNNVVQPDISPYKYYSHDNKLDATG